jgi:hypothetical protein
VPQANVHERRQRRDVAVHGKHRFGHDEFPPRCAGEQCSEMIDVGVPVDAQLRFRQPAAVDDRRVIQGVAEDRGPRGAKNR